ncbi:pyridoxal kinase [Kaistia dalseonensis]|uniref:pyridoxal kinase n=1 Tax=Kaistia dalseonensis TaxID=410840 RepID=A0ABU0H4F8_9HYPH|nr:pyridoxal kinase [Kaistia dalseonensis]MCX5494615.1 pyridoxal kinase [Kaistia dalseonensis]MDQ0437195.1 pyridoxine kinase [Kaistia dalseonensis]
MTGTTTERAPRPAVLVISSTVVRGAIGGRGAIFALERLGFPVWAVQTVTLPWHPGHGPAGRIVPDRAAFVTLIDDLIRAPWLGEIGGILSGYMGASWQAAEVARLIDAVKAKRPDALYICDPVMGDAGRLYVPEPTAVAIRDELAARADIATPNLTELNFLASVPTDSMSDVVALAGTLSPARVVVTSARSDQGDTETLLVGQARTIIASHPRIEGRVANGTGDLFAGLLLGRLLEGATDGEALQLATASVFEMLGAALRLGTDELPLATCQESLVAPQAHIALREQ